MNHLFISPITFLEYAIQAALSSLKFCLVIIPIVTLYEILKEHPFFSRQGKKLVPLAARLNFSPESIFPLSAGIFLGLVYGAGILINTSRETSLSRKDILILSIFLATCHAIIEDTFLFVVIGASGPWIIGPRIFMAIILSYLAGRLYKLPDKAS